MAKSAPINRHPAPIDPTYKPKVAITRLPANAPVEKILEVLDRDGGLIIENFVTAADLAKIDAEVEESKKDDIDNDLIGHGSGFPTIPSQTNLVGGLVGRSDTMADICDGPLLTELRNRILRDSFNIVREHYDEVSVVDPLLSISISFRIGTGAPRQALHRDDAVHGIDHTTTPFQLNKASQFACLVAGCKTTRENGATMFVPGSHKWDDSRRPRTDEVCFAEMEPGSALVFMGSAFHGGGHNSVPDSIRIVHGMFFVRGTYRQEENQFLAIPHKKVLQMTPTMKSLLGYKKPDTALGLVDNRDPCNDLESVFERLVR